MRYLAMTQDTGSQPDALVAFLLAEAAKAPITPADAARAFARTRTRPSDPPDAWRRWLTPMKQQAERLARSGQLVPLRKGHPVAPEEARGVVRYARPVEN